MIDKVKTIHQNSTYTWHVVDHILTLFWYHPFVVMSFQEQKSKMRSFRHKRMHFFQCICQMKNVFRFLMDQNPEFNWSWISKRQMILNTISIVLSVPADSRMLDHNDERLLPDRVDDHRRNRSIVFKFIDQFQLMIFLEIGALIKKRIFSVSDGILNLYSLKYWVHSDRYCSGTIDFVPTISEFLYLIIFFFLIRSYVKTIHMLFRDMDCMFTIAISVKLWVSGERPLDGRH